QEASVARGEKNHSCCGWLRWYLGCRGGPWRGLRNCRRPRFRMSCEERFHRFSLCSVGACFVRVSIIIIRRRFIAFGCGKRLNGNNPSRYELAQKISVQDPGTAFG